MSVKTYVYQCLLTGVSAVERAARRKYANYSFIKEADYIFLPLVYEKFGPWCVEIKKFVEAVMA